ncbi:MAG: hypothetical protein GY940_17220 [bacterium]|nr:hypothetical protein [bacterium]
MSYIKQYYPEYLEYTRVLFENLEKFPNFKTQMLAQGIDDGRIQVGIGARTGAWTSHDNYMSALNERDSQLKTVEELFDKAFGSYAGLVDRLRKEFYDDPQILAELELKGGRARTIAGFIDQSSRFYGACLTKDTIVAKLGAINITPEMIQSGKDDLEAYKTARSDFDEVKGRCQSLYATREKAFKPLRAWVALFKAAAKIAFADNLQELERLKIFVRNQPKPKPKPAAEEGTTQTTETTGTTETVESSPSSEPSEEQQG